MSRFNVNTTHPLIKNANDYYLYYKYLIIYSEDRDILKFPHASEFEIELPTDYCSVAGACLQSWSFPQTPTFTQKHNNISLSFQINEPYNPNLYGNTEQQQLDIYNGLFSNKNKNFVILIEQGTYSPNQMATELTNKMNDIVTIFIRNYLSSINNPDPNFIYKEFVVSFNEVSNNLWFGNSSSNFIITNQNVELYGPSVENTMNSCNNYSLPNFKTWGLPAYLGFTRCNSTSIQCQEGKLPQFFYLPVSSGNWLNFSSSFPGGPVFFLTTPNKINIIDSPFYYLSIKEFDCIDETSPYTLNNYSLTNNGNNGRVNSCFARIIVNPNTNGYQQWYCPNKLFVPPNERIRKLSISVHDHSGRLIDFDNQEFSMMIQFTLYVPQIGRNINLYDPKILY